jgi:hypothetical protein
MKKHYLLACLLSGILLAGTKAYSQDPNFHIYLCFGQSNMEGQGTIETHDKTVDSRFQVMEAVACSNLGRTKGTWYTAVPPLCRCYSGLSPADYFGKIMVANLPAEIKVGVINVSVAGCKIELFDKDNYQDYVSTITEDWLLNIINAYNGDPYGYLVEVAKLAQNEGVIKGILMHQGESNTGDNQWPSKVKAVYDNLINDLALNPDSVPLLAGEVVHADQGGVCASMNSIIETLPQTIPNSYIISSAGCTDAADNLHFNSAGYRELGKRYGLKMLSLMGKEITDSMIVEETQQGTELLYFEAECDATIGENWDILKDAQASNGSYVVVKSGIQSLNEAAGSDGIITIPFSVKSDGNFNVYARLNCTTADDDSYWIDMDDAGFTMANGLVTSGWQWVLLNSYELKAGAHTYSITYREDGARLDKICISNYANAPTGMGDEAENICVPDTSTVGLNKIETMDGYTLGQNYPNPFNGKTTISFIIPELTYVSLKVYNTLGVEIAELAGKEFISGTNFVEFNSNNLANGIYFYTLKAENFSATLKMILPGK